jgi:hypothetical protein
VTFYARYGITVERVRPTAKPSGSSAPSLAAGPTARSTAPAPSAPPRLTDGSGTTTITANTQPSVTNRPSLAFASATNLDGTYTYAEADCGCPGRSAPTSSWRTWDRAGSRDRIRPRPVPKCASPMPHASDH